MEEAFYMKVTAYIEALSPRKQKKYVITTETYNKVLLVLRGTKGTDGPKFKFWAKERFYVVKVGDQEILYSLKAKLPVVTYENLFEKINECHTAVGHFGRDKTWHEIKHRYSFIPLETVRIFISLCDHCVTRKVFPKPVVGKPIVSVGFMTRVQMDLVDMRSAEYNGFKWIFHAKDHFSKYSWLRPLVSKEAINVADVLKSIFYEFGPPRILQSDNGREFVAKVILDLTKMWPGLLIINGRPRHPQSQGLVERGNAVVQNLLGKWLDSNDTKDWPMGLGPVMFAINTSVAKTTNKTPFEVAFGQQPRLNDETWKLIEARLNDIRTNDGSPSNNESSALLEEDLPTDVADMIRQSDEQVTASDDEGIQVNNPFKKPQSSEVVVERNTTDGHICNADEDADEDANFDLNIDHEECIGDSGHMLIAAQAENTSNVVSQHAEIRQQAEQSYLSNAQSQLTKYMNRSAKRKRTYAIGDIVGLKVSDVDRTNTSSTILPCKIVHLHDDNDETFYTVATKSGIIKERFLSTAFLDLTTSNFTALRSFNVDSLPSITFIQACQIYTNFKSVDTCKCSGDCSTNRCQCKKKGRKCCTKCHNGSDVKCKNC